MSAGGFGDQPGGAADQPTQGWTQPGRSDQQPGWQPQYGQPGPYVQASAGWPQLAARRTNSLAIAALCCAIGQVIAGPFAGIAAIVVGAMSLSQIRQSGEDGRGMAITGLVLGIVGTVVAVFLLIFLLAIFHSVSSNLNNGNF
jgi:hypothetical protein